MISFQFFARTVLLFAFASSLAAAEMDGNPALTVTDSLGGGGIVLFNGTTVAPLLVDTNVNDAVLRAAGDLAEDFARVTGMKPALAGMASTNKDVRIIIGTLGESPVVDRLAAEGRLDVKGISGQWESYVLQIVTDPLPGVDRALVIAGSDRRGTIFGIYQLSAMIGVSPWHWWADVPVAQKKALALGGQIIKQGPPGVKYRGFFINDEDWGLSPWIAKTFDPQSGSIGPKTYAKVFELMLRLHLNYLWPAMHLCSKSFGDEPANAVLADKYGIVIGSSHCEPMLYNNIHWNEKTQGRWNYSVNQDGISNIWEKTAKARGGYEAVWTLGIRGIHDASMEQPPGDMPGKIELMSKIFHDQRGLLDEYASKQWGPVAQCFVPYKEVLPIYDAGLKVPEDVTLVWVDDNFGYIRRLSNPAERQRSGGAGVYWHLSYYGRPHSYTWINATAPALMWEELHKAWENDTRTLWVINVGDIKPMEIGIDYFSRLAWNPEGFSLGGQHQFLHDFAAQNFGATQAGPLADLLTDFYRLGTIRRPELMERKWALQLPPEQAVRLELDYKNLLGRERSVADALPAGLRDAYTEMIGFPARVVGDAGLIFMADRQIQQSNNVTAGENKIAQFRADLEAQVANYNTKVAGGKWNHMMPGLVTGKYPGAWNSEVRWPWGERTTADTNEPATEPAADRSWRDAATPDRQTASGSAHWSAIEGLGPRGRALVLEPASLDSSWGENDAKAPTAEFDFTSKGGDAEVLVNFLPTFRIYPGMKLRVAVNVDDRTPALVEAPGSNGAENENGPIRSAAVQNNYVIAKVPLANLAAGKHTLKIHAVDPGVVINAISLP
ncbi:MAG TPA: glycosyl hydrolase 115 family protein [Verrucomicrobiae bacterium]|nr:glycosyl hydrolase 115 family protein [Verrucomicrobiae bacterium]